MGKLIALCVRAGTISRSKTHLKMVFPESRSEAITPKSKPKARLSEVKTKIEGRIKSQMQRRHNESRTMLSTLHFCIEAQLKGGRKAGSIDGFSE